MKDGIREMMDLMLKIPLQKTVPYSHSGIEIPVFCWIEFRFRPCSVGTPPSHENKITADYNAFSHFLT